MVCEKQYGLQAELPVAEVEKVLETRTKEIHDHRVVVAFCAEPPHERNANAAGEGLIHL